MEQSKFSTLLLNLKLTLLAIALGFTTGCVTEPSALTGKSTSYGYSWQQELQLGQTSDQQIIQEMGLYQNDDLARYVVEVGERVLEECDLNSTDTPEIYRELDFKFRVMDSSVVNAFALPGGYVYVTRGLLSHLNNEAQLAVVLGHEITHVLGRHASKQALKQQFGQIGLVAGAVISSELLENPEIGNNIMQLGGNLFQLLTLKYGRDAERESDSYGVDYAALAGYDVAEAAAFFESLKRISNRSASQIPSWMSSHPDPGERSKTIIALAEEKRANGVNISKKGEAEYYAKIDGLVVGEDPRQGYLSDGIFYHPEMEFQFQLLEGWQLQNDATAVNMADVGGKSFLIFSTSVGESAQSAGQKFALDSGGSVIADSSKRINGSSAFVVEILLSDGVEPTNAYCTFIEHGDRIFSFVGLTKDVDYESLRPSFAKISNSFQKMDSGAASRVSAARLQVVTANRTAEFESFIPQDLPSGIDALGLAIMNQVELNTVIRSGSKIKLPTL
ncbi:M48 family metalloprotease [Puniceicoccaceae bacterium K14]|nr:M48 family metalloprotease [Puniceicoccaceae bacterium K14]